MNYFFITEDEYNALDSARSQLSFVSRLVENSAASREISEAEGLGEFLLAQSQTLKTITTAAHQRYMEAYEKNSLPSITKQVNRKNLAAKACTTVGGGV